jgi:hypothetical protein
VTLLPLENNFTFKNGGTTLFTLDTITLQYNTSVKNILFLNNLCSSFSAPAYNLDLGC